MESSNKKNIEEKQIKIYVKNGSVLYDKFNKLAKEHNYTDAIAFIEKEISKSLHIMDEYSLDAGTCKVEKIGNKKQIYIEWPENKQNEKLSIVFSHGHNNPPEYILKNISIDDLKNEAEKIMPKTCKISCRTAPGKQPSIRVQFPDDNKVTFYQDGWVNGKNSSIHIHQNSPIKETDDFKIYSVGQGDDAVEISYRKTGNKSIRITNKNGDGICIYPDLYINPVKNGHMTKQGSQKINCNLFEFIENNFFKVNYNKNKSVLKKPIQNASHNVPQQYQFQSGINNPFNNQPSNIIQNAPNNSMLYSLNETNEFTINL